MKTQFMIFLSIVLLSQCSESTTTTELSYPEISCKPKPINCKGINKVCGLFDPTKIQCVRFPCGTTFDTPCQACNDNRIVSYINTPCENINTPVVTNDTPITTSIHNNNDIKHHLKPKL